MMSITIPITTTSSKPLTWETLEIAWELMMLRNGRWYCAQAKERIDAWIPKGTVVFAKESKGGVLIMKEEGTHCRVLERTIACIVLSPPHPDKTYTFVTQEEEEALNLQWNSIRQLSTLVAHEMAEEASKHLSRILPT